VAQDALNRSGEFVIGGYTKGGRTFDALIFGYWEGGRLMCAARTRNGFTPSSRERLMERLRPLETPECSGRQPARRTQGGVEPRGLPDRVGQLRQDLAGEHLPPGSQRLRHHIPSTQTITSRRRVLNYVSCLDYTDDRLKLTDVTRTMAAAWRSELRTAIRSDANQLPP
jgi:hypothetical protein